MDARRARAHDLRLNNERVDQVLGRVGNNAKPDPNAQMHRSLTVPWWPAEFVLKKHYNWKTRKSGWRLNLFRRRTFLPGASIHEFVFARRDYKPKLPPDAVRVATLPRP